jgi:hypothetical protein
MFPPSWRYRGAWILPLLISVQFVLISFANDMNCARTHHPFPVLAMDPERIGDFA